MKIIILALISITIMSCNKENPLIGKWKSDYELSKDYNLKSSNLNENEIKVLLDSVIGNRTITFISNDEMIVESKAISMKVGSELLKIPAVKNSVEYKIESIKDTQCVFKFTSSEETQQYNLTSPNQFWVEFKLHPNEGNKRHHIIIREYFNKIEQSQ